MTYSENARMTANVRRMGRTAATVVLAGVLAAGILGAYLFVLKKSGLDKAIQDGTALLEQISVQGLDSYLGRAPRRQYFVLEEDGKPVGFAAVTLEPKLNDDGTLIYLGRHFVNKKSGKNEGEWGHRYLISNDLKSFQSRMEYPNAVEIISCKDGELRVHLSIFEISRRPLVASRTVNQFFVCPGLEDVISSIALDSAYSRGVAFEMPSVLLIDEKLHLNSQLFWVSPSDLAPPGASSSVDGRGAKTSWYEDGRFKKKQLLYYSRNHELIWQKDEIEPLFTSVDVTREALLSQYPDAEQVLRRWFSNEHEEPDKEDISTPAGDFL